MKSVILSFAVSLTFSGLVQAQTCAEMSKQFFLMEMDGIVGKNAPPVKDRPQYVAKLLVKVKQEYPDADAVKCLHAGLQQAKSEKQMQEKRFKSEIL